MRSEGSVLCSCHSDAISLPWRTIRTIDAKRPSLGGSNLSPDRPEVMKLR
jgi:hypothetical protein